MPHFNLPNFNLQTLLINIEETDTMKLGIEKSTNTLQDIFMRLYIATTEILAVRKYGEISQKTRHKTKPQLSK